MAAEFRVEVAKQKEARQAKKRQARSKALVEHLEALAEAQRKRKAGPSALDPIRDVPNPMQETKGKVKHKKNKLVRLLHLSALAVMSQPVDTQLASWTTGAAVDCGPEWARKAVDIAVARGSHPTAIAPEATALVHEDIDYQVKAGFTEIVYWDEIKDALPLHFKVSPVPVIPRTDGRRGRIILDLLLRQCNDPEANSDRTSERNRKRLAKAISFYGFNARRPRDLTKQSRLLGWFLATPCGTRTEVELLLRHA